MCAWSYLNLCNGVDLLFRQQKLPVVPETLLKQRKKRDDVRKAKIFARQATKKVRNWLKMSLDDAMV